MRFSKNSTTLLLRSSSAWLRQVTPMARACSSSWSKYGTISAETKLRESAMIATCSMKASLPRVPSTRWGATYWPLEVFMSSLMRSVKMRLPAASRPPASPVRR